MKTEVYDWTKEKTERIVRTAVRILDNGGLAAIPTETVYGLACRAEPATIKRLDVVKARAEGKRYSLHIGSPADVLRYVPRASLRAKALIRKGLPGPITLICKLSPEELEQQKAKLGEKVCRVLYDNNSIGIRCPDHPAAMQILSEAVWPIVAPSANPSGSQPAITAQMVLDYFNSQIEMVVDGGKDACRYQKSSTVVELSDKRIEILREGVFTQKDIDNLSTVNICFVCTGNTCRSPMAQVLAENYLAGKISCGIDELELFGYKIDSFGISAYDGCPASENAVKALLEKGLSLQNHRSKLLTRRDVRDADIIFVMSRIHLEAVLSLDNKTADRVFLLDPNGDIPDPIGMDYEEYRACSVRIAQALEKRFKDLI